MKKSLGAMTYAMPTRSGWWEPMIKMANRTWQQSPGEVSAVPILRQ